MPDTRLDAGDSRRRLWSLFPWAPGPAGGHVHRSAFAAREGSVVMETPARGREAGRGPEADGTVPVLSSVLTATLSQPPGSHPHQLPTSLLSSSAFSICSVHWTAGASPDGAEGRGVYWEQMCSWDQWKSRFSPWLLVTAVPLVPVLPQVPTASSLAPSPPAW